MLPRNAGRDEELVRRVLEGGRTGQPAGLELLLRRRPRCWEDAVGLLGSEADSPNALDALSEAWRMYRRMDAMYGASKR
jgi:hypothetical protein